MRQQGGQMPVYHGASFQRGYGLGSFFQSLSRRALPFLQKGAQTLGRAAFNTGVNIAHDVLRGNNVKESTRSRLQQTAKNLKEQALNRLTSQTGSGGKPLKRKVAQKNLTLPQPTKGERAKTTPKSTSQRKRKSPQIQGQVKKSKVSHLKDLWEK